MNARFRCYLREDINFEVLNYQFCYDYEYLGDCLHPVWTAQLESALFAFLMAFQLKYFPFLRGETSTGKLTLVSEVARLLARPLFVRDVGPALSERDSHDGEEEIGLFLVKLSFNLFHPWQYIQGVAQSGSWLCLRDFDTLPIETLSCLAPELFNFCRALTELQQSKTSRKLIRLNEAEVNISARGFICFNSSSSPSVSQLPTNLNVISISTL